MGLLQWFIRAVAARDQQKQRKKQTQDDDEEHIRGYQNVIEGSVSLDSE